MKKPSILLIEDDPVHMELVSAFFRQKDFTVIARTDAQSALQDLKKLRINCDLVLTDLFLPNISGIDFIKSLKSLRPQIPIILMTASASVETTVEAVTAGAFDFVVKPLHFPQLMISVQRAFHFYNLETENKNLREVFSLQKESGGVVAKNPGMKNAVDLARRVSNSTANVLIQGESGTGKEIIAKTIHNSGSRSQKPFVAINCSAIPEHLLESELFGYVKGAFTGANDKRLGLFEEAEGGTLFLDEIGDLSMALQAKLLRVLQERKIRRLGENQMRDIDVRVISATHKNLKQAVANNMFREDLFFRLNVIPIAIPALRDRPEDILPLAEHFMKKYAALNKSMVTSFSREALEFLQGLSWKGNVRELENCIERAVVLCQNTQIQKSDLVMFFDSSDTRNAPSSFKGLHIDLDETTGMPTLRQFEAQYIKYVLEKFSGARDQTAKTLGVDRKTLYRRIQEMELTQSSSF